MTVFIALLRAVNVGGSAPLKMSTLSEFLIDLGYSEVRTVLQSGNAVFRSPSGTPATVERRLEEELLNRLGLATQVFVRTASEWQSVIAQNPFPEAAMSDPSHLLLVALKSGPTLSEWTAVRAGIAGPEQVGGTGREAYVVYPNGIGHSPVTMAWIERKLGTPGTGRNWNTVRKLAELAGA